MNLIVVILVVILILSLAGGGYGFRRGNNNFGQVFTQCNTPRSVQFGFKYQF